jgi:superfamily II DNA or RNA helicase
MQNSPTAISETANSGSGRIRVGDRVRVRHQRWVITERRPFDDCAALTLTGIGPANSGQQQQILTPFDVVEPLTSRRSFRIVRGTRWRRACRQLIADAGSAGTLRTARSAHMDLLPYQLEPALAVVHGRGTRMLIADEVGLGKTVQAALIVAELKARGAISRVLVLTPAGLREQWVDEFVTRFDLPLSLFDMSSAARRRTSLPIGVNPWSVEPFVIASIDYIKRPEVLPAVQACRWDVVIVDEAHHATLGTDRHAAVNTLCRIAPYVVLLTATPHNGDSQAFRSLCALGQQDDDPLLVFRRTRQQLGHPRERRIHQLRVRPGSEERRMHVALDAFVRAVHREPGGRDASTWLALSTLHKRALSSAFALLRSVEHRLDALDVDDGRVAQQLTLPMFDSGGEFETADNPPVWTIPALEDARHERELLSRVRHAAQLALGRESKLSALARLIRRIEEPAIVFTEYRDTLVHVRHHIAPHATLLHGGLTREERRAAIAQFRRGGLLLATDAAGEGLNLHHNCRIVVNLELPWNPVRLEQRIGRVDRIGQTRRVHAFHLIASGTAEVRMLHRLGSRIARAHADVGTSNPLDAEHPTADTPTVAFTRMAIEAEHEHNRLTIARRMMPDQPTGIRLTLDVERHPLVTFSRHRRLRFWLKVRPLVLVRSVLFDASGQVIASHLTALHLAVEPGRACSFQRLERIRERLPSSSDYDEWLASSCSIHLAFWNARLSRERGIADLRRSLAAGELQPGLFDLRAEQAWADEQEQQREGIRESNWFTSWANRRATIETEPPQIALVLFTD